MQIEGANMSGHGDPIPNDVNMPCGPLRGHAGMCRGTSDSHRALDCHLGGECCRRATIVGCLRQDVLDTA